MSRLLQVLLSACLLIRPAFAVDRATFWNFQHRGANIFNEKIPTSTLRAAKEYGIDFLRIAPDKFNSKQRDFLIGDADAYKGLVEADYKQLKETLDSCASLDIPVVLTMLSLPGSRWKQNNNDKDDLRLWQSDEFVKQCASFWHDLASRLEDHPAIVGYDVLNEPHLERLRDQQTNGSYQERLYKFNAAVVQAIREVDSLTPIIVEPSSYADPKALAEMIPLEDSLVIYSIHMYEPYTYTNKKTNDGRFSYPGNITDDAGSTVYWDRRKLADYFSAVILFQQKNQIPPSRILVGEFGANRQSPGVSEYLSDLISIFEENHWQWAVYSFREDTWDGMNYEIGGAKLSWKYWQDLEKGLSPEVPLDPDNPIFMILRKAWSNSQ